MRPTCPHCGRQQYGYHTTQNTECQQCHKHLPESIRMVWNMQEEWRSLRRRLEDDTEAFGRKISALETACIDAIETESSSEASANTTHGANAPTSYPNAEQDEILASNQPEEEENFPPFWVRPLFEDTSNEERIIEEKETQEEEVSNISEDAVDDTYAVIVEESNTPKTPKEVIDFQAGTSTPEYIGTDEAEDEELEPALAIEPAEPKSYQPTIFDAIWTFLAELIFTPLGQLKEMAVEIYQHYKKQNQLPVFFMTLGGVAALLFGFGYLMKKADDAYFEYAKIIAGLVAAGAVTWWGARLLRQYDRYSEFGSALLGLGISLVYLSLYAMSISPAMTWASGAVATVLLLGNTAWGAWLALKYDTKVVAFISLIGGACVPFFLQSESIGMMYWVSLWVISAGSIWLSYRIEWKPLATMTFIVAAGIIEWAVWNNGTLGNTWSSLFLYHAFAYLFFYQTFFVGKHLKYYLNASEAVILAANLSLFIFNLFELLDGQTSTLLGWVCLLNAAAFLGAYFKWRSLLPATMRTLFFVLAGAWLALAVPSLFGQGLMGLVWGVEGLALVVCGLLFALPHVRKEAYALLLIAFWRLLSTSPELMTQLDQAQGIWNLPFFNWISVGLVLMGAVGVWTYLGKGQLKRFEERMLYFTKEIITAWALSVWAMLTWYYTDIAIFNWGLVPMGLVTWWGYRQKLKVSELMGMACYILPWIGFARSAMEVESMRFFMQTGLGKIAFLEAVLPLWALQFFFEKFMPDSRYIKPVRILREVFYIGMPWAILSPFYRHWPEWAGLGYLLAAVIAFGLAELLRKQPMVFAKVIVRNQGYAAAVFALLKLLNGGIAVYTTSSPFSIWNIHFAQAALIGPLLVGLWAYLRFVRQEKEAGELSIERFSFEGVSLWFSYMVSTIALFYFDDWAMLGLPLLVIALMLWARRFELRGTEVLSWILYLLPVVIAIFIAVVKSSLGNVDGVFAWLEWPLLDQLLLLEAAVLLWCLPTLALFRALSLNKVKYPSLALSARELFFALLPVIALPTYCLYMEEQWAVGAWGSMVIGLGLHHARGKNWLKIETYALAALATVLLVAQPTVLGAFAGLAILGAIFVVKRGYLPSVAHNAYKNLMAYGVYYLGLVFMLMYGRMTEDLIGMAFIGAAYGYLLVHLRKKIHVLRGNEQLAYFIGLSLSALGLVFWLVMVASGHEQPYLWLQLGLAVLMLSLKGFMAYRPASSYLPSLLGWWKSDVVAFHVGCMVAYSTMSLAAATPEWTGVVLTVMLTIHAIVLLFNAAVPAYKFLMRWALAVFIGAAVKLKFFDMANFPLEKQIIVLMIVGVLLLVGANVFTRIRKRLSQEEGEV